METMSRLALMAVLSRAGRGTTEEKVTWNGSAGYLPIITVEDYDAAEAGNRPRRGRPPPSGQGRWSLGEALFAAVLAMQCCAVVGVEAWIIWNGSETGSDYDVWNWLSEFASPGLLVLFSVSFSGILLHAVRAQGRSSDVAFQAAGLAMATFCSVLVCAGVSAVETGKEEVEGLWRFVVVVVGMWMLFFCGLLGAGWRWYRGDRQTETGRKGKRRERGYGTTSGGLAMEDETFERLDGF
ncbi:hypothetical protein CPLU01_07359 [Colletotrichum plurivorum]|uniref:Uncharacterized protein n=1 Tax=Colletotrichum plurivorum TaxID=2175906 RepID=A0A8H6NF05_9PEZI|nr:hypothetical protein CPLU01_07359 [Colletotrichum plurivorum]